MQNANTLFAVMRSRGEKGQPVERLYRMLFNQELYLRAYAKLYPNKGSMTPGATPETIDEMSLKKIDRIIEAIKFERYQWTPVRRTHIKKANGKLQPLGLPVLQDRIVQEALRAILDPIYETDFQPYSFGFRKGRCTMDAIAVIMSLAGPITKYYYIIEGDIKGYFDTVHHRKLLSILKQRIADRNILDLIWKFLKAGVMEEGLFARTETGVPQGGVISPLLANVYLNEFDKWADARWNISQWERSKRRSAGKGNYCLIRYADDFVVMSNDGIAGVQQARREVQDFLKTELLLELSEEKTRLTHVHDGFDFLGFHIQRVRSGGRGALHLRPTGKSKERIKKKIKDLTSRNWSWMDEYTRLTTLNAIIRGWSEYYKYTSLLADIEEITRYTWFRYLGWLLKKHKGSRKHNLIAVKTKTILNRTRWTAEIHEGEKVLFAYQWQPTRKEYPRRRFYQKGRNGFPHPYLMEEPDAMNYPTGEIGPDETIFTLIIGVPNNQASRNEPLEMAELKLRAKMRDDFKCVRCSSTENICVHHKKGTKSHSLRNLETLCLKCHQAEHGYHEAE